MYRRDRDTFRRLVLRDVRPVLARQESLLVGISAAKWFRCCGLCFCHRGVRAVVIEGNGLYRRRAINEAWRALSELNEVYHVMRDARDEIVVERVCYRRDLDRRNQKGVKQWLKMMAGTTRGLTPDGRHLGSDAGRGARTDIWVYRRTSGIAAELPEEASTPERLISSKRSSSLTGCAVYAVVPVFYSCVCSGLIHGAGNRVRDWLARSTVGSSMSCGRRPLSEVEICA